MHVVLLNQQSLPFASPPHFVTDMQVQKPQLVIELCSDSSLPDCLQAATLVMRDLPAQLWKDKEDAAQ